MDRDQGALSAIYLDMDGVLCDFVGGALKLYGLDPGLRDEVDRWDGIPHVITRHMVAEGRPGVVRDENLWEDIGLAGESFWAGLDWLPWGRELFALCSSVAPVVLMTTPTRHPSSAAGKMRWIQDHIPTDHYRYAMTPCKHHMAHPGALLVDDNDGNAAKFDEHGGVGFLWPMPWNERRKLAAKDHDRARALQDLADVIAEMRRPR